MLVLLDARQHQQVVDQAAHALGLLGHDAEEALARGGIVARRAAQGLDEAGQSRDRRLELVAGIGDEVGAHALGAAQRRRVVQHDQGERAVGRRARQAAQMGDHVELGRAGQHELDASLVGAGEIAVGGVEQPVDRREKLRLAEHGREIALGAGAAQKLAGGEVGAHDTAAAVDGDQRIGQAVDDRLGGGREIVDRGALAAPAGRELGRRRRQLLGGGREGKPRHHGLALVAEFADEAGEAGERAEIALHQPDRDHGDARHGDERRTAGEIARPVKDQQRGKRRCQGHGVGGEIAAQRNGLHYPRRGEKKRMAASP